MFQTQLNHTSAGNAIFRPTIFRLANKTEADELQALADRTPGLSVYDSLDRQLAELVKSQHPTERFTDEQLQEKGQALLGNTPHAAYGVWVYYPWSQRLVHMLDEAEFVLLRTNRNVYKITPEERALLATKKIGVIGLSVGQSAALTIAMERQCGELRIADFDLLDLSNLNRIRAGVHNLGLLKTVVVAREIAEIDPFITVVPFDEGITPENIDRFLTENGKLDVLVEECDGLDIKILARVRAQAYSIPVVMDTSDRGLMDIERFDLEPTRPILHGKIPPLSPEAVKALTPPERFGLAAAFVDVANTSERFRMSLGEIGKTISTWPQLASAVVLGGAVVAHVTRSICLGTPLPSGRYYVDLDQVFSGQ
ncbi:ThiF family protein [Chitinophaga costaii]|uniref:ThiF family protein n=1 Tax=Chitinophaga costaii TaxID=1335309 RepID=A0A1C4F285_9BACT|nr:ThiF family adenylyltransferase [Chitinophaga costaii]PUZ22134.1 hypothetical protein DCM91_15540 [Chitinophaga costaii]SCC49926.1 ThiF family protein [Chitinophaga costaii]